MWLWTQESYPQIYDAAAETDPEKHWTDADQKPFTKCLIPCCELQFKTARPEIKNVWKSRLWKRRQTFKVLSFTNSQKHKNIGYRFLYIIYVPEANLMLFFGPKWYSLRSLLKKVSILGPPPLPMAPCHKWYPHQNHYVPRYINNRLHGVLNGPE